MMGRKYKGGNSATVRRQNLMRYGLTVESYQVLFDSRNGLCAICGRASIRRLAVDHNHITGKVRALLCVNCNVGIGYFKENITVMLKAIEYLNRHN